MWYSWSSPIAIAILLAGIGALFKGLTAHSSCGCDCSPKKK